MNKFILVTAMLLAGIVSSCAKDKTDDRNPYGNGPSTPVPVSLQGTWMYGNFSLTEYWTQNPADYLGNALELAIAFKFNANGTFEQYFTSRTVILGVVTYNQSVSKGTVEIDEATRTIITYTNSSHYKQTKNGQTIVDRDLNKNEITSPTTTYSFQTGTEPNGTKAIYLKLNGTSSPLTFLQKS